MNSIELKTLNELSQYSFYIPAYQRGYRWTEQEVKDLLNDINEFIPREISDTEEKTWYCLQPVVVKSRSENEYEVIDGQQRLTTIYLILHYLNQDFVEKRRDKLFSIYLCTRLMICSSSSRMGRYSDLLTYSYSIFYSPFPNILPLTDHLTVHR